MVMDHHETDVNRPLPFNTAEEVVFNIYGLLLNEIERNLPRQLEWAKNFKLPSGVVGTCANHVIYVPGSLNLHVFIKMFEGLT